MTDRSPERSLPSARWRRSAIITLLVGSLLAGLAQVASLPPFEGADELAHYSYIQQIAETGRWPRLGDPLSADIDRYESLAPLPKAASGRWTYQSFADSSPDVIDAARAYINNPLDGARGWRPGSGENWQAQHPPLYYLLLSPLYLATKSWSLLHQLSALRMFSYVIAWLAIIVVIATAWRMQGLAPHMRTALMLAPALWPALLPAWFPQMARLGNDSLLVLIASLGWIALVRVHFEPARIGNYLLLGAICALGMLTKATMAPFVGVVGAYLLFVCWVRSRTGIVDRQQFGRLVAFGLTLFLIAGWWYALKLRDTGDLLGSIEAIRLNAAGGLMRGLQERGDLRSFLLGLLMTLLTFLWGGTWSFVMPALSLYAPFAVLLGLLAIGWSIAAHRRLDALEVIPVVTLLVFCAGLIRHAIVTMALVGPSFAAGWYIHAIMPVLAPALGLALAGVMASRLLRWPTLIAMLYVPIFMIFAMAGQSVFFAGCALQRPSPLADGFLAGMPCGLDIATIYARLSVLAFPSAATLFLLAGVTLLMAGVLAAGLALRPASSAAS